MNAKRIGISLLALALCLSAVCAQEKAEKLRPRIQLVSEQTVPLGELASYDVRTVAYRFKNSGPGVANILNMVSTCPCVSATSDKMAIQPGEEFVVTLRLDASKVHEPFRRSVWVETNDPETPRLMLSVTGSIRPLFTGLPPMPVRLFASGAGTVWTNVYTVTATETNIALGTPTIATNGGIRLEVSITTNAAPDKNGYTLRAILTSLGSGKAAATAAIPVEGRPDLNLHPLALVFQSTSGAMLRVAPSKVLLAPSDRALTRTLRLSTSEKEARPEALTWSPQVEGFSATAEPGLIKSSLMVSISLTPECVEKLLKSKETKITFSYPDHKPVTIEFGEGSSRRNPPALPQFKGGMPFLPKK